MVICCPSSLAVRRNNQNFPVAENRRSENSTGESIVVLERNFGRRHYWAFQDPRDIGDILGEIVGIVYHCRCEMHK